MMKAIMPFLVQGNPETQQSQQTQLSLKSDKMVCIMHQQHSSCRRMQEWCNVGPVRQPLEW